MLALQLHSAASVLAVHWILWLQCGQMLPPPSVPVTYTSYTLPHPYRLRAMLMGALDGVLSVASVMLGVGGGSGDLQYMRLAGLAAWMAGALSMFLGEYASVAAQRDSEAADIEKEKDMQAQGPEARAHELDELTQIYVNRGLCYDTARKVGG